MPRKNAIWWRASRRAWYVTIDGKKVPLGKNKKDAEKKFHSLMLSKGKVDLSQETVYQLCNLYLSDAETRVKPATFEIYRKYLQLFCDTHGKRVASHLKPIDLTSWIASHKDWNQNTRSLVTNVVKIWSKWCRRQRCISEDPFKEIPASKTGRRKPPPAGAVEKFLNGITNPPFRALMELSVLLGTRPGELGTLEASRIDLQARTAIVVGKKGERRIQIPECATAILEPLMREWPEGPILRNSLGKPWCRATISYNVHATCRRAGVKGVVHYHLRGAFATKGIKNGVHPLLISKLLGHADPKIVYQYYEQLDDDDLKQAIEQVARTTTAGTVSESSSSGEGTPQQES